MAHGREKKAFDQSFDFFSSKTGGADKDESYASSASSSPWRRSDTGLFTNAESSMGEGNTSDPFAFSTDLFPRDPLFSVEESFSSSSFSPPRLDTNRNKANNNNTNVSNSYQKGQLPLVQVAIHEQLSALYDEVSSDGSVCVEGSIYVQTPKEGMAAPFCLVFRDLLDQVERCEERGEVCHNITERAIAATAASHNKSSSGQPPPQLHRSDRVLRVTIPNNLSTAFTEKIAILNYVCVPHLRPVPLLVKSRVRLSRDSTRVGLKIRANPSNELPLTRIIIMLAVPPTIDGDSVRMSRQGGLWDEMKRTVSWSIPNLDPGEAMEIQAQFHSLNAGGTHSATMDRLLTFPVLVRCDYPKLFSSVEVVAEYVDSLSSPIKIIVDSSARIIHRKV